MDDERFDICLYMALNGYDLGLAFESDEEEEVENEERD